MSDRSDGLPSSLRFLDAAVAINRRALWSGVTLDLEQGQFAAVLGPNGSGKSTLVRAILGVQPLSAGRIEVLGMPAGQGNRDIGYLPQRRSFDSSTRVRGRDIVSLGFDGNRYGLPLPFGARRRAVRAAVNEALDLVVGQHLADRPIGQLSGGEQQRLLIAQALVRRPKLLLLDEPLDSLDLPTQASIAALIAEVCRQQQVTVVMVAHDVNPILAHLDNVIYLANGRVAVGPPREVITGPRLSGLFGTSIEVLQASDGRLVVVGGPDPSHAHGDRHEHS